MSGSVCIGGCVWKENGSLRPASLSRCICHPCPGDIFFSLSSCTLNSESCPCRLLEAPLIFHSLVVGVFYFFVPWTVGYNINIRWRQKASSLHLCGRHAPHRACRLAVEQGFPSFVCILSQHSYPNWARLTSGRLWSCCEVRALRQVNSADLASRVCLTVVEGFMLQCLLFAPFPSYFSSMAASCNVPGLGRL